MRLSILGSRGIPAAHGGFETFAEHLALYLTSHGWDVTVYCQYSAEIQSIREDVWNGIRRVNISVKNEGAASTILFDWLASRHAAKEHGLVLMLGYNTAIFCLLLRLNRRCNLINMDGIEWKRAKWKPIERAWLYINEWLGCWFGNHLIADHPAIAKHLSTRVSSSKITMIPYGANEVRDAKLDLLAALGVEPDRFITVIARPEPENSILEIVRTFSRKIRGVKLVLLGKYDPVHNDFHRAVIEAASTEVMMPGAIYDKSVVQALRFYGRLYVHGHRIGGTNPSLVEALGAGSPILAHDNCFNRWVAGEKAHYFQDEDSLAQELELLLQDSEEIGRMRIASRSRFYQMFTWDAVLGQYESLLLNWNNC